MRHRLLQFTGNAWLALALLLAPALSTAQSSHPASPPATPPADWDPVSINLEAPEVLNDELIRFLSRGT